MLKVTLIFIGWFLAMCAVLTFLGKNKSQTSDLKPAQVAGAAKEEGPLTVLDRKETDWVLHSDFENMAGTNLFVATANRKDYNKNGERIVFLEPANWAQAWEKIPRKGDKITVAWVRVRSHSDAGFVSSSPTAYMFFVVK